MVLKIAAIALFALFACAAAVARPVASQQSVRTYEDSSKCQLKYSVCCTYSYVCGYEEKDYQKSPKYCDKEVCSDEKYYDVKDEYYVPTEDDYKKAIEYEKQYTSHDHGGYIPESKDYGSYHKDYSYEKKYGYDEKKYGYDEKKDVYGEKKDVYGEKKDVYGEKKDVYGDPKTTY